MGLKLVNSINWDLNFPTDILNQRGNSIAIGKVVLLLLARTRIRIEKAQVLK